ncbi:hypothetical protein GJV26_14710 [Massilia dura]|uniref:Uncharacterized protein n=1 Tax=Pseudoduganella dura TaxID=321982 RepID=A0A6I3XKH4_9BURK|nr:hypothetical protein [Pseudoduganella dura]MUI13702.1 hypothetical protein [Pseudoduganella dura]GGX74792.1 hypothetical protein GCM10007386_02140 [Pseudoduganella dura]
MAREQNERVVKEMIQSLYRLAGIYPVWDGQVNDAVAEVVEKMLLETRNCSQAFVWVPKPPTGRASVLWLAMNVGRAAFATSRAKLSQTCARKVILNWRTTLELASQGLASSRMRMRA